MSKPGLDKWYAYMKSHDTAALWDLLHPDAVFESPVVHAPQRGRDITFKYLTSAALVRSRPRSVPHCGSVRFMVPVHSPVTSFSR